MRKKIVVDEKRLRSVLQLLRSSLRYGDEETLTRDVRIEVSRLDSIISQGETLKQE